MKNTFHIRRSFLLITCVIGPLFCNSCKENTNPEIVFSIVQPAKIVAEREPVLLSMENPEIKPEKKEPLTPEVNYNIFIPGRTMQSAEFIPGIQNSINMEGISLNVPASGMNQTESISITGLLAEDLPPIPGEMTNVTKDYYAGYRFLPHGMLFDSVVTISMAYDKNLIPEGFSAEDIYTWYFDESDHKWKSLERDSINHELCLVVSGTLHFTDMINGIIKVPESPETEGYAPTTITDIKAADPTAGITLIAPPSANSQGDAELSFPFKLPVGRSGMQPQLSLQYSSGGSSGWVGYGWGLNVSGISVDITWGVPRYVADKESETYLFAGSQLTPVAHRSEYIDRTSEKRFYSRIEGDFSKIIRHGDSLTNYWWEVATKDGVRNFYGGLPETGIDPDAVSSDAKGNIGYWALVKSLDLHDNFVSYKYDKPEECGQQLYIREITYTGHGTEDGPYKITFIRTNYERKDARINARYGFIQRDKELLRRINITFNSESVRSYTFNYREGVFLKTLLDSVTELNASGIEFYTHKFDYYNDIKVDNEIIPFANEKKWDIPDDTLKSPFLNLFNNISALGGSGSNGNSKGGSLTFGKNDGKIFLKSNTAGGNFSWSKSDNEGFMTLIDLNGDGLPDKVFKKVDKEFLPELNGNGLQVFKEVDRVYYRPNLLSDPNSEEIFGDRKLVAGITDFSCSTATGFSWGIEVNIDKFLGYNHFNSETQTDIYFGDFNADGLIDLVDNELVYFNHINKNGYPVFTDSSVLTPNPLYANSDIDLSILPDPAEEQAKLEAQFPLHDAVRMWQAPYGGVIRIIAPVNLAENLSQDAIDDTHKDGVKVSIQHNDNVLWIDSIAANYYTEKLPGLSNIKINKGDRLYFRVQSRFNGAYDKVHWDPEVLYDTINGSDTLVKLIDSNGEKIGRFKASEDFLFCGLQSVFMPDTGTVKIKTDFSKPITTDTIKLEIIYTDNEQSDSILDSREYYPSEIINESINLVKEVLYDESIHFRVSSSTNVDWSSIKCNNYVEYTIIDDSIPPPGNDGKPLLSFMAVPEFTKMYNNPVRQELPIIADKAFMDSLGVETTDSTYYQMELKPYIVLTSTEEDDTSSIMLSIKSRNKMPGDSLYRFERNAIIESDSLVASVRLGDTLFFEYFFSNRELAESLDTASVIIGSDTLKASVFTTINPDDAIFGHLYRGWGQFDYNGNFERSKTPIDTSLLRLSVNYNENVATMDSTDLDGVQNPLDEVFNVMILYAVKSVYMCTDEQVYISPEYMSSSRLGEKDVHVDSYDFSGPGLKVPSKITTNKSNSVAKGIISGIFSLSVSRGEGYLDIDMMDMNGDRYPDLVSNDTIQYTDVNGVLSRPSVYHALGKHSSISWAGGITLGGSHIIAKSGNSISNDPSSGEKGRSGNNFKTNNNARNAQLTAKASAGISGNFSYNRDATREAWLDINGDGLPDKINSDGEVWLNIGYSFVQVEDWNFAAICVGKSLDYGAGAGVNISFGSIQLGGGLSKTITESETTFMDINADGLPDIVEGNEVSFNTGSSFADPVEWAGLGDCGSEPFLWDINNFLIDPAEALGIKEGASTGIEASMSVGESVNLAFTIGVPIPFTPFKFCINPSGSLSTGVSHILSQLEDINGDGMPDFLSSNNEGELYVRLSNINRTNYLKSVHHAIGSNFTLDYSPTAATYNHPGGKMAVTSVKMFDGHIGDGKDTTYVTFEYKDGFYDRHERRFYGFASVISSYHNTGENNSIYRTMEQQFSNKDYYTSGKLIEETLTNSIGRKQAGSRNFYTFHDIHSGISLPEKYVQSDRYPIFVALSETISYSYLGASDSIATRITYNYDTLGNISGYTDYSSGNEKDWYSVAIKYHNNSDNYLYSIPAQQEITSIEGLKRKCETTINEFGDITQIRKFITNDQIAQFDMEYDQYGNLTKIIRPANYKGERMWFEYEYDPAVHSFITEVKDAYGYNSSSVYDYKWGSPVEVTDRNGQKMKYSFDDCGRMTTLTGPYELASGKPYTIKFEYHPEAKIPYAHTLHYDSIYNSNIETYSFTDGLGRPVQVKKTASLFEASAAEDTPGFIVSGMVMYDAFGRITEAYQPVFEGIANPTVFNIVTDNYEPALAEYDELDRLLQITMPDGSVNKHTYSIGDYYGETMHIDSLVDDLNHITVTYKKAKGLLAATIRKSIAGDIITNFEYNALGELLKVTDPIGNETVSVYDMTGNRISVSEPDAGLTEFNYDDAGNMIKKITANLRSQIPERGAICYNYDHERLVEIIYPRSIQNRVNYTYGEPGAPYNRAGRLVLLQDASGGQEFFYSKLGQVIKTIRTIQLGEADMRTWIWSATYDTWNRVQTMTYPDGEKVTYSYNRAGNLEKMDGDKLGRSYEYISRIGYNKYEKQVYLQYGNGSATTYDYEPKLQRLVQMDVTANNMTLMDNSYTYDALGNILGITNSAEATGDIGASGSHTYSYDELYRLTDASGMFRGKNETGNYTLAMKYDIMGKILHKKQEHIINDEEQSATTYDVEYSYESIQPNTATKIGTRIFDYDANGNLISWEDTVSKNFRQLLWDEENRLTLISDNGYLNSYVYDASGARVLKSHGGMQGVYINGAPASIVNHSENKYTLYVSPFFVFKDESFTKHYYSGSTRVTSKIGNGQFENQYRPGVFEITAGEVNYINRQQQLQTAKKEYVKQSGIPPGPPVMKGIYADPAFSGIAYPDAGTPEFNTPRGWPKKPVFSPAGGPPGAPIKWGDDVTNENVEAGLGFVGTGNIEEDLSYFYHSDHIGSVSCVTNATGNVTQYIAYIPFGETFADQHAVWNSSYKFNAKELDSETGLYYYGTRYYDPKVSMWLGVGEEAKQNLSLSPYVYEDNNPVTDKLNGLDNQSVLYTIKQKSSKQSIRLYMVTISSNNIPNSISNLSMLFEGTNYNILSVDEINSLLGRDPIEKPKKKPTEAIVAIPEIAGPEDKIKPDREEVKVEDANIDKSPASDINADQKIEKGIKPAENSEKPAEISEKEIIPRAKTKKSNESGGDTKKVTTLETTKKQDVK